MFPDPGYSIHEGLFDRAAVLEVLEALDRAELTRTRAGARHVLAVPAIRALASEPALVRIARQYLGVNAFPFRATLFDKSAASNWLVAWHQDTALPIRRQMDVSGWGPWSEKGGVLHAITPAGALGPVIALTGATRGSYTICLSRRNPEVNRPFASYILWARQRSCRFVVVVSPPSANGTTW